MGSLGTEATSSLLTEVVEVLTPDLHGCLTILGAVSWIEREDSSWLIVGVQSLIDAVREVTSDGDL